MKDIDILLDIAGATNFQDLKKTASMKLSAMQEQMYSRKESKNSLEELSDKLNSLTNEK